MRKLAKPIDYFLSPLSILVLLRYVKTEYSDIPRLQYLRRSHHVFKKHTLRLELVSNRSFSYRRTDSSDLHSPRIKITF